MAVLCHDPALKLKPSFDDYKPFESYQIMSANAGPSNPAGYLRATTSRNLGGYGWIPESRRSQETRNIKIIPPMFEGPKPQPSYLPPQWTKHVHPEGMSYFVRTGSLRVVTDVDLFKPGALDKIMSCVGGIETRMRELEIDSSDKLELFVGVEGDDCSYYFVDHNTRTEFWLEDMHTENLGISAIGSASHLKLALEELYWIHVEHFPMHLGGISMTVVDDLISVFSHGFTDHLTSSTSNFIYSKEECKTMLEFLRASRHEIADGHHSFCIARLWKTITTHRLTTLFGQTRTRLSREQSLQTGWLAVVSSSLTFGSSAQFLAELEGVYVDHLHSPDKFRIFISDRLQDWKWSTVLAFASLQMQTASTYPQPIKSLAAVSLVLLSMALMTSFSLIMRYSLMEKAATDSAEHIQGIRSPRHGFALAAAAYAMPTTCLLYGLATLFINFMVAVAHEASVSVSVGLSSGVVVFLAVFRWLYSSKCLGLPSISLSKIFRDSYAKSSKTKVSAV